MHSKCIMHCDITPENIGFGSISDSTSSICSGNENNTGLKLYNFGRARILKARDGTQAQPYDLSLVTHSPMVGTLPYAAPEIGMKGRHCCGLGVDTYAFAMITWEILTLKAALDDFHQFLMEDANQSVAITPKMDSSIPETLRDLIEQCWKANPQFRPRMDIACSTIEDFQHREDLMQVDMSDIYSQY